MLAYKSDTVGTHSTASLVVAVSPYPRPPTFKISLIIVCKRVNHSPASFPRTWEMGMLIDYLRLRLIAHSRSHTLSTSSSKKHSVPTYSLKGVQFDRSASSI